jgi:hypothetical protein
MYLVHHVKIINIRNYESFEIRRQSDKYFWWWETLSGCGRGDGWWSYPDNENSFKKMWDFDDFENMFPVQENVNIL